MWFQDPQTPSLGGFARKACRHAGRERKRRAWLWATCPDAKIRDGKNAVESAKQALELDPKNANTIDTLAAAYAENGDFVEAVRWQERAMEDVQFKNDKDARRRLVLYRDKKPYRQEWDE